LNVEAAYVATHLWCPFRVKRYFHFLEKRSGWPILELRRLVSASPSTLQPPSTPFNPLDAQQNNISSGSLDVINPMLESSVTGSI
jgi:hypothetical protein